MKAVVDTNVIFSALLKKESAIKRLLLDPSNTFYTCNFLFVEIFKHKEKIEKNSRLSFDALIASMRIMLTRIHFINEDAIPAKYFQKALSLCSEIDPNDTPFVALSLFKNLPLLTGDKKLLNGLKTKGFKKMIPLESIIGDKSP